MRRTIRNLILTAVGVLSLALLLRAALPQVNTGTWGAAGPMTQPRSGAGAALLQDGRVLITGGEDSNGPSVTAELFDSNGAFSAAAPLSVTRSGHISVVLGDGRVLVAGGTTAGGGVTNAAEIYDPIANSWASVAGGMTEARVGHTASLLQDGRVLIAGGHSGGSTSSTLEIFDPVSGSFASAGILSSPRTSHAAAVLVDGRVLIIGGSNGSAPLASSDIFDPSTGSASLGPAPLSPRAGHSATSLLDGRVLVAGGNNGANDLASAEIFDASTNAFSAVASTLAAPRRDHLAFPLPHNNNVLIVGGTSSGTAVAAAELFRPWTGTFSATGSLSSGRSAATGSPLAQDGLLLVAGGKDASTTPNTLSSAELYGFATVKTDKADYQPGDIVTITGSGWQPGETVTLSLVEVPLIDTHGPFAAVADGAGNIFNNQFALNTLDVNVRFYLTAIGTTSQAQTTFTDASSLTIKSGTAGFEITMPSGATDRTMNVSQAFTVQSIIHSSPGVSWTAVTVTLSVPLGWTKTADPAAFSLAVNSDSSPKTWTVTPPATPSSGNLTVNVSGTPSSGGCSGPGSNTCTDSRVLAVSAVNPAALSFGTVQAFDSSASPTDTVVRAVQQVTVKVTVNNTGGATANGATAPTLATPTATGTATASCGGGSPGSGNISGGGSRTYTYTCSSIGGDGTLTFATSGQASGTDENTGSSVGTSGDATSNSVTVDSTPPTATITSNPTNPTTSTSATFSFSGNDPVVGGVSSGADHLECQLDGGGFSACVSPKTYTGLSLGSHTFQVRAVDVAGNIGTPASFTWSIVTDVTPPQVTVSFAPIVHGSAGWYNSQDTVPVAGTATATDPSNVASISCTDSAGGLTQGALTGGGTTSASGSLSVSGDGTHNISCSATDGVGNSGAASGSTNTATLKIDTTSPSLTFGAASPAPNAAGWNNTNVSIPFTASDATSGVASTNPAASPLVLSTEGTAVTGTVTVTDVAGNSAIFTSSAVKIDKTPPNPPTPSVSPSPNAAGWNNTNVTVTFNGNGDSGTVQSGGVTCTSPISLTSETTGTLESGTCTDAAGNVSSTASVTVKIDKTPPNAPSASVSPNPNAAGWNNTNVTVTFTDNGDAGAVQSGIASCTSLISLSTETAGTLESGTCTDVAGNTSAPASVTVKIDKTPPTLNFAAQSPAANANGWNNTNVSFGFTTADNLSGVSSTSVPTPLVLTTEGTAVTGTVTVTDVAGNSATFTSPTVMIDKTPPTATAAASPAPNANGWNNTNVTVTFTGTDTLSGIDHCDAPVTLSTEGTNLSTSGTCTDKAGNVSASASKSGINIDKTPPTATASASPGPNANGWNNTDVTVTFTGTDTLSGIDHCDAPVTLSAEAMNQSASGTCTDKAGNVSSQATASGINIDKTPPTLSFGAQSPAANAAGWNNTDVSFTFTTADSLSGVFSTSIPSPLVLTSEGTSVSGTVTVTDKAGNSATFTSSAVKIDKTPPTINGSRTPAANANGWNNTNVTVSFACADTLSGLAGGSPPADTPLSAEGANQSVNKTCYDVAGNSASATVNGINIDKTAPVITFVSRTPANSYGWNNSTVTLNWSCTDSLSGPVQSSLTNTLPNEGANQSSTATCTDLAGNSGSNTQTGVNIDLTPPTLNPSISPTPVLLNGAATASPNGSDNLSGIASQSCPAVVTNSVGSHTLTCTATDKAGNITNKPVTYDVYYASSGMCGGDAGHQVLQPINWQGDSVFKLGSTVPTKFRVCDANGVSIQASGPYPVVASYQLIAAGTNTGLSIDESVYSTTPDTAFRWSSTDQQWIFNQATKNNGTLNQANTIYVFRIYLNDGSYIQFQYGLK